MTTRGQPGRLLRSARHPHRMCARPERGRVPTGEGYADNSPKVTTSAAGGPSTSDFASARSAASPRRERADRATLSIARDLRGGPAVGPNEHGAVTVRALPGFAYRESPPFGSEGDQRRKMVCGSCSSIATKLQSDRNRLVLADIGRLLYFGVLFIGP